jgi:hypothetical protein
MRTKTLVILALVTALILVPSVSARKGVGLVWSTEAEVVSEGGQKCITYGVYNPWDEDVRMQLTVSETLKPILVGTQSDVRTISANTGHENAVPVQLCFNVGSVYRTCDNPEVALSGKVMAVEAPEANAQGTGSATALGVSVPLSLRVSCNSELHNYTIAYVLGSVALVAAVLLFVARRKKR